MADHWKRRPSFSMNMGLANHMTYMALAVHPAALASLWRLAVTSALVMALAACSNLLPRGRSEEPSGFADYESAREALEQIRPYQTGLDELGRLGFQVGSSANLERVPYPQWVPLLLGQNVPLDQADIGIRDCLAARAECQAYVFRFSRIKSERHGSFLADVFNFKRNTSVRGWRFEGIVLIRGNVVLFRNHRGQPKIDLYEERTNPLGPFQSMGDALALPYKP